jgi:endogenous inhibitor of DNA gyrase (YacG/DUF329 family)
MNKISNYLKSFAVRNWQKYSFKKEWASVIILMLILKISTSAVSIFSGYYYLDNLFFSLFSVEFVAKTFSIIALVLVEGLCALFLAKFFKFALRLEFKTAVLPFFCALIVFTISFIISTNGIALFTSETEDLTKEIQQKYNFQVAELKKECNENIKQIESYIATIKSNPENWSNGKRCILSEKQNTDITTAFNQIQLYKSDLNTALKKIEILRKNEIEENNKETINKADKYYKIVAVIMLIQIICSGGLWFFWSKIAAQDAPENEYKEAMTNIYDRANNLIDDGLNVCIMQKFNLVATAFQQLENDLHTKQLQQEQKMKADVKREKKVGFDAPQKTQIESVKTSDVDTQKNAGTRGVSEVENVILTPSKNALTVRKCLCCGKELTEKQNARNAKFCSANCRVKHYNETHPERKQISLKNENLTH